MYYVFCALDPSTQTRFGCYGLELEKIDDLIEEYILAQRKIKDLESKIHKHFDAEKNRTIFFIKIALSHMEETKS